MKFYGSPKQSKILGMDQKTIFIVTYSVNECNLNAARMTMPWVTPVRFLFFPYSKTIVIFYLLNANDLRHNTLFAEVRLSFSFKNTFELRSLMECRLKYSAVIPKNSRAWAEKMWQLWIKCIALPSRILSSVEEWLNISNFACENCILYH